MPSPHTVIITANPAGWTIHTFDHVATDDELRKLFEEGGCKEVYLEHCPTIPPYRYIRADVPNFWLSNGPASYSTVSYLALEKES